jgi:hypothetical protein
MESKKILNTKKTFEQKEITNFKRKKIIFKIFNYIYDLIDGLIKYFKIN